MLKPALLAAAVAAALATAAHADPVVAVVDTPLPAGTPRAQVVAAMEQLAPTYRQAPGLLHKAFTIGDGTVGGVYPWSSRAAADAFYAGPWRAQSRARTGVDPKITFYEAPVVIEGANPAGGR